MLDEKIKNLELRIKSISESSNTDTKRFRDNRLFLKDLRDTFSAKFNEVVNDISSVIDAISSNEKKEEENEASPASIRKQLNLNWVPKEDVVEGNSVVNARLSEGSYWCAKSEEVLDGAFICRILVEYIGDVYDWHHQAGIIMHDQYTPGEYYVNSALFLSSGIFQIPFQGSNSNTRYPQKWKSGDEIIIKRDFDNDLWFGLNNEFDMLKSAKVEGKVRIAMGFLNTNKREEIFKLIHLQYLC